MVAAQEEGIPMSLLSKRPRFLELAHVLLCEHMRDDVFPETEEILSSSRREGSSESSGLPWCPRRRLKFERREESVLKQGLLGVALLLVLYLVM
eukprot:763623-Hanusia_phi.AAC.12